MKIALQSTLALLLLAVGYSSCVRAESVDFAEATPYYEEDGWLDVSEWFDGNDYNPTDETWWRWDDETYDVADDTGADRDSDGWYGYSAADDDDWYYDYYDPTPYSFSDYDHNASYDYGTRYFDYDNDGTYEAYMSYSDLDGDGHYDEYNYYSFTDNSSDKQRQQARQNAARDSREHAVSGKVHKAKMVQVRDGKRHVVVAIQPEQSESGKSGSDKMVIADLGPSKALDAQPPIGSSITVRGPKARVGEKSVVLAKSVEMDGKSHSIDRSRRTIDGKVLSTHTTKIRGREHQMAMVEAMQNGQQRKIVVDLGPSDRLNTKLKKGDTLTFSGFPVKANDKYLMIAQSIEKDDQLVEINRQPATEQRTSDQDDKQSQDKQSQDKRGNNKSGK